MDLDLNLEQGEFTNCSYTEKTEKFPLNYSHYVSSHFLVKPISGARTVKRYISEDNPYPQGMIDDNLDNHLQRGFNYLNDVLQETDENEVDKNYAILMWLLHDLDELRLSNDDCAIDNPKDTEEGYKFFLSTIDDGLASKEEVAFKTKCYQDFKKAACFLKGEIDVPRSIENGFLTALVVRVVDNIDGNLFFYNRLKEWIENGNYFPEEHMSLPFLFKQRDTYIKQLHLLPESKTKRLLIYLVNYQVEHVRNIWRENEDKMPKILSKHLNSPTLYNNPQPL